MKAYRRLMLLMTFLLLLIFIFTNGVILRQRPTESRAYRVEISRAAAVIRNQGYENLDLGAYPSLVRVVPGCTEDESFLQGSEEAYALREIDGTVYRFDYRLAENRQELLVTVNAGLGTASLLLLGIMIFIRHQILRPFQQLRELPGNLAKGNLNTPLRQQKSRYFGEFLWGMDLLREQLESQKQQALKLQKEKKSLLLSLTHDIKTPLSAIKLYSQALSRNLYKDPRKQVETAESISRKVDEIESYLGKIVSAGREDFLHLEVHNGEFYLSEVMEEIRNYYEDKLQLLKIPFALHDGSDCLLKGDRDRAVEVFQNLLENAIKYGNGTFISIAGSEEGGCRILTVCNGGCTLPEGELPHIFDSFWRGSNGQKIQGSGLGLYICRQLMTAMGGEIFGEISGSTMKISVVFEKV